MIFLKDVHEYDGSCYINMSINCSLSFHCNILVTYQRGGEAVSSGGR